MKIVTLIDNTPDVEGRLASEHGLSMYMEVDGMRILLDTGLSSAFMDNAKLIGVDLNELDFCFLSHGHNDHTGGLRRFMEDIPDVRVFLSDKVLSEHFFSSRHTNKRNLSTDDGVLSEFASRIVPINESRWITDTIAAVYCDCHEYPSPCGNVFLTKDIDGVESADDFSHELALVVKTKHGLVVLSSCSHCGAVNIMKSCERFTGISTVSHFIGGLHFVDCNKTAKEVKAFCECVSSEYPDTTFITGHCTSDKAKVCFKDEEFDISFFRTGSVMEI